MERRAFLKFMIAGAGAAAAVAASGEALALTSLPAVPPAGAPEPAVATPADLEQAKVEQTQWGYYRRRYYWRPRRRFFWRRPRVWRRRRYYRYY
jgi:hypothetical protein